MCKMSFPSFVTSSFAFMLFEEALLYIKGRFPVVTLHPHILIHNNSKIKTLKYRNETRKCKKPLMPKSEGNLQRGCQSSPSLSYCVATGSKSKFKLCFNVPEDFIIFSFCAILTTTTLLNAISISVIK